MVWNSEEMSRSSHVNCSNTSLNLMDAIFLLEEEARISFLRNIGRALGCTYICLWFYLPPKLLLSKGGWYKDETNRPSSSSGSSRALNLFDAYRKIPFNTETGFVPGLALKSGLPYIVLPDSHMTEFALVEIQRLFYQEARVKTVVFMACQSGEIELGMPTASNFHMEMEMMNILSEVIPQLDPLLPDQSKPSSSSSSLMSLSVGSPEHSSLFRNMASTSYKPESVKGTWIDQTIKPASAIHPPPQLIVQPYGQDPNVRIPPRGSDEDAMTRALSALISSYSSSSSPVSQNQEQIHERRGAFSLYLTPHPATQMKPSSNGQKLMKKVFAILSRIPAQAVGAQVQETRPPITNQLQHVISERRRREKLNEYIQALKLLLPPETKRDKASVLSTAMESLRTLKDQVSVLSEKNRLLEARLSQGKQAREVVVARNGRVGIGITEASESSSQARQVEVQVLVREDVCETTDLVVRLLECLRNMNNVSLVSLEADTQLQGTNRFSGVTLRLKVKTSEWDEQSFKDAMTRAVDDEEQ